MGCPHRLLAAACLLLATAAARATLQHGDTGIADTPSPLAQGGDAVDAAPDRDALANQLLQEAYGFQDAKAPAHKGEMMRVAQVAPEAAPPARVGVVAGAAVDSTQSRFTAATDATVLGGADAGQGEPKSGSKAKTLASSLLKTAAVVGQKWQEGQAAKAARKPKANQCFMCVYTLERMRQVLTPASSYPDTDVVGRGMGPAGPMASGGGAGRPPLGILPTSAFTGPMPPRTAWGNGGTGPWQARTSGEGGGPTFSSAPPQHAQPPEAMQFPSGDAPDELLDGAKRTPVTMPGEEAGSAAAGGGGEGASTSNLRFRSMRVDEGSRGGDTDSAPHWAPFSSIMAMYGSESEMGDSGGSRSGVPYPTLDPTAEGWAPHMGGMELYPYDQTNHPHPPALGVPPIIPSDADMPPAGWTTWLSRWSPSHASNPPPSSPPHSASGEGGQVPATALLQEGDTQASAPPCTGGPCDGGESPHHDPPAHMFAHWYHNPPAHHEVHAARGNAPQPPDAVAGELHPAAATLYGRYLHAARAHLAAAVQERAEDELVGQWMAQHGMAEGQFSASVYKEGAHPPATHPHTTNAHNSGGARHHEGTSDKATNGATVLLEGGGRDSDPTASVPGTGSNSGSPTLRTGTPLDGASWGTDAATVAAGAPAQEGGVVPVYRDFAGEAALFGDAPREVSPDLAVPWEAGQPPPLAPPQPDLAPHAASSGAAGAGGGGLPGGAGPRQVGTAAAGDATPRRSPTEPDGTIAVGVWRGGGDVPSYSRSAAAPVTEDVWWGDSYVAPGHTPRVGGDATATTYLPPSTPQLKPDVAAIAARASAAMSGEGNKAVERLFGREGLRGQPQYTDADDAAVAPYPSLPDLNTTSPDLVLAQEAAMAAAESAGGGGSPGASAAPPNTTTTAATSFLERDAFNPIGALTSGLTKLAAAAMFPLPHSCRTDESLCPQRLRQPSLYDMYRRRRRDEQRASMNRALLSYSMALDVVCERDEAGIDTDAARTPPVAEEGMAGYPDLQSESHRRYGYIVDDWSFATARTEYGDRVGIGSLKHYALPDPFREFCPKIRAQLATVVERMLHGYDEEEVCYALKMCPFEMVQVWRPGSPTSAMGNAMAALGLGTKAGDTDQRVG